MPHQPQIFIYGACLAHIDENTFPLEWDHMAAWHNVYVHNVHQRDRGSIRSPSKNYYRNTN